MLFQNASAVKTPKQAKRLYQVPYGSVGSLTPTVNYLVKNGQIQFVRRRSPRKKKVAGDAEEGPLSALARTPLNRKTPKLFTPSGQDDFLTPGSKENSPAGVN